MKDLGSEKKARMGTLGLFGAQFSLAWRGEELVQIDAGNIMQYIYYV
jgi:hypothetical protein